MFRSFFNVEIKELSSNYLTKKHLKKIEIFWFDLWKRIRVAKNFFDSDLL